MDEFPRTQVGGISMPRMIIGTNWILGYSHTSLAQDRLIRERQTRERIAEILTVFLENGVDAIMFPPRGRLHQANHFYEAIQDAQDRTGRGLIRILTPIFNVAPGGPPDEEPEVMLDRCKAEGATFCLPHQAVTDALVDRAHKCIDGIDRVTAMIRERGMIPGLSTHMPEAVTYADRIGADVETYIQIYNAAGFLMQIEVDWVNRIIRDAKKPVITIKPLAAGRLIPLVGLAFAWSTIRDQDMVTIGTLSPATERVAENAQQALT
jgi:hypothetical protein